MTNVIVYNAGTKEVLHEVPLKHAIRMLDRKVAFVVDAHEDTFGPHPRPKALELVKYVFTKWLYDTTGRVPYSRSGVLRRDKHSCAYCGRAAVTIDHVTPRCQGGQSTWLNVVAACSKCNGAKKGRTPRQAGMKLQWHPFEPTPADLFPRQASRRR